MDREIQNLVLFGAGGMAKEVAALVRDINKEALLFRHVAYAVDDAYFQEGMEIHGIPVFSRKWLLEHRRDVVCACAVGYPKERRAIQQKLMQEGVGFVNLIHPTTRLRKGTTLGRGCIIEPDCDISVDCRLGDGIFLNGDVNIGHDVVLEDYVTCFPRCQISGKVRIGEAACIGSMSYINERRKIGAEAVIAPGSIVFNNVKEGSHVMGNPAKRIEL